MDGDRRRHLGTVGVILRSNLRTAHVVAALARACIKVGIGRAINRRVAGLARHGRIDAVARHDRDEVMFVRVEVDVGGVKLGALRRVGAAGSIAHIADSRGAKYRLSALARYAADAARGDHRHGG